MECIYSYKKVQTSFDQKFLPFSNPKVHNKGFAIRTIQKGGGGPASTKILGFIVLKRESINKQNIKINSPKNFSSWMEIYCGTQNN